jgi:hypothetical protein
MDGGHGTNDQEETRNRREPELADLFRYWTRSSKYSDRFEPAGSTQGRSPAALSCEKCKHTPENHAIGVRFSWVHNQPRVHTLNLAALMPIESDSNG